MADIPKDVLISEFVLVRISTYIFIVLVVIISCEQPKVAVKLVSVLLFRLSWVQTFPTDGLSWISYGNSGIPSPRKPQPYSSRSLQYIICNYINYSH